MSTKREVVAQLSTEDLKLLANAAEIAIKQGMVVQERKVRRAIKLLRTVRAAKQEGT